MKSGASASLPEAITTSFHLAVCNRPVLAFWPSILASEESNLCAN